MSNIDDKLRQNRERFGRKLEDVRGDNDLSLEGKARHIAPLYQAAKAEEARLRQARRDGLAERTRAAERKAFAPPSLRGSDPALTEMNFRAALDSVEKITDNAELARKLERATLTGDRTLARAAAIRANELGADRVVTAYLATDEQAQKDWTQWADAHAEMAGSGLGETFDSGIPSLEEPDELRGQGHAQAASFG
jgi:hypothetical protein